MITRITPRGYAAMASWWRAWELPITPYEWLPHHTYIADDTVAGSLFRMGDGALFWIEGIVSNPEAKNKTESLRRLIEYLTELANSQGAKMVLTSTPREGLKRAFEAAGYQVAPERYFHLGKRL